MALLAEGGKVDMIIAYQRMLLDESALGTSASEACPLVVCMGCILNVDAEVVAVVIIVVPVAVYACPLLTRSSSFALCPNMICD